MIVRKKLYKAKKNWVVASVAGAAVLTVQLQHQNAHAATVNSSDTTKQVTASTTDTMGTVHHAQNQLSQAVQQASQAGVHVTAGASQVVKTPAEATHALQQQTTTLHSQASQAQSLANSYAHANSQYQQASQANDKAWSQYRDDVTKVNAANSAAMAKHTSAVNSAVAHNQQVASANSQAQSQYQAKLASAQAQNSQIQAQNSQALSSYATAVNSVANDNSKITASNSAAMSAYRDKLASAVAHNNSVAVSNSMAMSSYDSAVASTASYNANVTAHNQELEHDYQNRVDSMTAANNSYASAQASYAKAASEVAAHNSAVTSANDSAQASYAKANSQYMAESAQYQADKAAYDAWTKALGVTPDQLPMINKTGATSWQINSNNSLNIRVNSAPDAVCQVSGFNGANITKVDGKDLMFNGDSPYGFNIQYPNEQNYNGTLGTITYTNLGSAILYNGQPISKLVYEISNLQSNADDWHSKPGLTIYSDPTNGLGVNKGSMTVTMHMYDQDGHEIDLKNAYLFFGSINEWWDVVNAQHPSLVPKNDNHADNGNGPFVGDPYGGTPQHPGKHVEYIESGNGSHLVPLEGSEVSVHGDKAYADASIAGEIMQNGKLIHWDQEGTPGEVIGGVALQLSGTAPQFTFGSISSSNDGINGMWTPISTTIPASKPDYHPLSKPQQPKLSPLTALPPKPEKPVATPLITPNPLPLRPMPNKPVLQPTVVLPPEPTPEKSEAIPTKPTLKPLVALPTAPTLEKPVPMPTMTPLTPLPPAPSTFKDQAPAKPATINGTYHDVTVANPTITIHYVDDLTGKELTTPITITGTYGSTYEGEQKQFKDYQYRDETGLPTKGQLTQDGELVYHYIGERPVTVHYVDQTGKDIAPVKTTTQAIGSKYHTAPATIPGYQYQNETGSPSDGTVSQDGNTIYYHYNEPTTITVHYVDQHGKDIQPAKTITGNVGDKYQTKPTDIPGYQYHNETGLPNDGTLPKTGGNIYYHYDQRGKITVHYVDQNGKEIAPEKTITGNVGDKYRTIHPNIKGYKYHNETGDLPTGNLPVTGNVYYHYDQVGTVTVHYVDPNGKQLHPEQTLTGDVGTKYQTTPVTVPGYHLEKTTGDSTGQYTGQPQTVTYVYAPDTPATKPHKVTPVQTPQVTPTPQAVTPAPQPAPVQPTVAQPTVAQPTVAQPVNVQPVTAQPAVQAEAPVVPQATIAPQVTQPTVAQATLPSTGDKHDDDMDLAVLALIAGASLAGIGLIDKKRE